jgi:hypothetical protein
MNASLVVKVKTGTFTSTDLVEQQGITYTLLKMYLKTSPLLCTPRGIAKLVVFDGYYDSVSIETSND